MKIKQLSEVLKIKQKLFSTTKTRLIYNKIPERSKFSSGGIKKENKEDKLSVK